MTRWKFLVAVFAPFAVRAQTQTQTQMLKRRRKYYIPLIALPDGAEMDVCAFSQAGVIETTGASRVEALLNSGLIVMTEDEWKRLDLRRFDKFCAVNPNK